MIAADLGPAAAPHPREQGQGGLGPLPPYVVDALDLAAGSITTGLLLTAALGVGGSIGVLLALGFVTFVPGWAILDWLPVGDGVTKVALAVVLSLTLCTAASQGLLWLHLWHPLALLDTLGPLSLIAVSSHLEFAGSAGSAGGAGARG